MIVKYPIDKVTPSVPALKVSGLSLAALVISLSLIAQEPVRWTWWATHTGTNLYEVHVKASIADGWHIYPMKAPADHGKATTIRFERNALAQPVDYLKENAKWVKQSKQGSRMNSQLNTMVDYVQTFRVSGACDKEITGWISYSACKFNDCRPPRMVTFSIPIRYIK